MAMVKLNTFHWHITDSQSFPLELESYPEFSRIGAYSADKIYTHEDISDVNNIKFINIYANYDICLSLYNLDISICTYSWCTCNTRI